MLIVLNAVLCAVLVWTCFCRLVWTSKRTTAPEIRLGLLALATAGIVALAHPFWSGEPPTPASVGLVAAMLLVQLASARLWRNGVPDPFQRAHP